MVFASSNSGPKSSSRAIPGNVLFEGTALFVLIAMLNLEKKLSNFENAVIPEFYNIFQTFLRAESIDELTSHFHN